METEANFRKEYVYGRLNELEHALKLDSFNLNPNEQDMLLKRLEEFKQVLDQTYS